MLQNVKRQTDGRYTNYIIYLSIFRTAFSYVLHYRIRQKQKKYHKTRIALVYVCLYHIIFIEKPSYCDILCCGQKNESGKAHSARLHANFLLVSMCMIYESKMICPCVYNIYIRLCTCLCI